MPPERFAPAISTSGQPQTHALDRATTRVISELLSQGNEFLSVPHISISKSDLGINVMSFYINTWWEMVMHWTTWFLIGPGKPAVNMIRTVRFHKRL
jgi:hypothetical protein